MGTNYYWIHGACDKCGRHDRTHIGKSSGGWEFNFHGTEAIRSWKTWQQVLSKSGFVEDEYGRQTPLHEFIALVEGKRGGKNHIDYCLMERNHRDNIAVALGTGQAWKDEEGFAFSAGEFS